ncbi:hypothetical protein Lal_00048335 [Lupinus albus]|uniref:Putative polynucleotide adenylyltransferase n=1 Tax=Lupinus albus TaxID=3870 RepID=A0A6A4QQ47_LUPAL|nr:putative polynucleotide adenylyltransferase [Lupinus albus]KAF1869055.1 hypothetical protein Lal_00048335 [Lupinus albus]
MGEYEGWAEPPSGLLHNGLLPNEAASVINLVDSERWMKAEERTAELIACIQPNPLSEERRIAIADYVQRLIMKCFPCQVFTFGSVPLKTYLPDGDIDLTAFCKNQNLKDTWAHQVRDMLESEEKNENAEFRVKEVQYIQAEVKIIKCLVDNIVVDISFNQLGGLCTLCFLEEVDNLISQDHLFKRSIILIKAWCYYESRLLGAHHGLISTYALETLVLYIFHVFNNSFAGPLEVLYRFLEFFSKFDWDNFCISLCGPVPISSLPDVTAEPPRKDGGDLLLSKSFLEACGSVYSVFPGGQENQGLPFVSKHFNVIDPLRENNNLGRSISKGNFYRIRSAFALGTKRLARLLNCPEEELVFEVNQFFTNTWKRHVSGQQSDAPSSDLSLLRLSSHKESPRSENLSNNNHKIDRASNREFHAEGEHVSRRGPSQHSNLSSENSFKSSDVSPALHTQNQKSHGNEYSSRAFEQLRRETNSNHGSHIVKGQRNDKADKPVSDVHGKFLFARTRSSPELTDSYGEVSSKGRRTRAPESIKGQNSFAKLEISRRKNLEPDVGTNYSVRIDDSSARHNSSRQVLDSAAESNNASNSCHDELVVGEEFASVAGAGKIQMMHQEEQELLNTMTSPTAQGFSGQDHVPMSFAGGHLPFPFPPSILASTGYAQRNMGHIPFIEAPWGPNMQFPPGLVPSHFTPYFPGMELTCNPEDVIETGNDNCSPVEMNPADVDNGFWHEQERCSASGVEVDNGNSEMLPDDKQQPTSSSYNFASTSRLGSSSRSARIQKKFTKESQGSSREEHIHNFHYEDGRRNEIHFDDWIANSQLPTPSPSSSLRSKTSSESSWDGSLAKTSKPTREKRGKKNAPSAPSNRHGKGKNVSEISSNRADGENREWTLVESDVSERSTKAPAVSSMHVPRHQIPAFEVAQTSESDSPFPIAPMILGPGSRQRAVDNSGVAPFTFYPTGPPVPFVTMLPLYNFPTESSDTSTSNFNVEEVGDNSDSGHNVDSNERYNQPEVSSPSNSMSKVAFELSEHKSNILNSDFLSHWQNLQYGRFCQNTRHPPSTIYPSPFMVPPVYLHGRYPWDGPGRPVSPDMNIFSQLMSYEPHLVPVAPFQSVSNRSATNIYQRFADDIPRYRSGTGTYLPNPKVSVRDRQSTNTRRGNYNYDRRDHNGDREGNWNMNSKFRATGRAHSRNQTDKPGSKPERFATSESRAERPWGSHVHDSLASHQNGPVRSNSSQNNPGNVAYGMYPIPGMNPTGVSSNGPRMPSVVMFYPYDHNVSYNTPAEQLEFGSLGQMGYSGVNEFSQVNEGSRSSGAFEEQRFHGDSAYRSSPDQPSSLHVSRGP